MKPVLIQTLHRHNQKKKPKNLETVEIDPSHGGPRDRAGFIILLIIIMSIIIATVMS
jgi:hypothetical protein